MLFHNTRREFLKHTALTAAGGFLAMQASPLWADQEPEVLFDISLAEWSLHQTLFAGKLENMQFPETALKTYGIRAVEYVNAFFNDKARDTAYLTELKQRCSDLGVKSLLIMVDGEGELGAPNDADRRKSVENHFRWVEAAKFLGCHSIRVNAASQGSFDEQQRLAADGLAQLCDFAADHGLNVIVENHGGLSSHGVWLAGVMKMVGKANCGTLPDFGNFRISDTEMYDRYQGVTELMPFAKAVSAKSHDFDEKGNEIHTDYHRMLKVVVDAGYHGYVGIEYEGKKISEHDGILATKRLLERVRESMG